jgi:prolipoprotein diacylglyceryltransferase
MYFMENTYNNGSWTQNSIQLRWSAIQKVVSKFAGIFSMACRRNKSGKTMQDRVVIVLTIAYLFHVISASSFTLIFRQINDAIKIYNSNEP